MDCAQELDEGADGLAATSRPHSQFYVVPDGPPSLRDAGVPVRRYVTTQVDAILSGARLTQDQRSALQHASALHRAAALLPWVVSRYEEWVSGASGRHQTVDDSEDQAAPWRDLLRALPRGPAAALESAVMGDLRLHQADHLLEALDRVAEWQSETEE